MHRWLVPATIRSSPLPTRLFRTATSRQSSRLITTVARLLSLQPNGDEEEHIIHGFVRSIRKQRHVAFAVVGDGSSFKPLQVVLRPEQADKLSVGVAVSVRGAWVSSPKGKEQTHELQASHVEALGGHEHSNYPLQKKWHTPDFLRRIPHLRTRTAQHGVLLRFRSECIAAVTSYFKEKEFIQCHTPIITSSDCEGAGEVFTVSPRTRKPIIPSSSNIPVGHEDYFFNDPKYLTVSSQLHLEALAQSVGKVWTLSPAFRAEHSDTSRHLSEFYMLEAELAFAESLPDILDLAEETICSMVRAVQALQIYEEILSRQAFVCEQSKLNDHPAPVSPLILEQRWNGMLAVPWPRITFARAIEILKEHERDGIFEMPVDALSGLHSDHERFIAEHVGQGKPVFVTDYPSTVKPFYMSPSQTSVHCTEYVSTVACFDLLVPEACEIAGGSMREHRLDALLDSMISKNLGSIEMQKALSWYIDLRRYGSVPHGGFGIGFDRLLGHLAGVGSLKDIVTFPRWFGQCAT